MSHTTETFVRELVERQPSLAPLLNEHLADNFGELLPHVFFGELTRYVLARREVESPVLSLLEHAYGEGNPELQELISVSFLEHLPRPGEEGSEIRERLGPHLRAQLRAIG